MSEYLGGPFIYSTGGSLTCSICAPDYISAEDIEAFAYLQLGATEDGNRWRVFDKSKLEFLQPTLATPHLCNHAPNRLHWFLIDSKMAEQWATAEARCRACGGEMVLINVIEDMSMPVVGLERRAYMCSACGITEQRTAINKQAKKNTTPRLVLFSIHDLLHRLRVSIISEQLRVSWDVCWLAYAATRKARPNRRASQANRDRYRGGWEHRAGRVQA